MYLSYFNNMSYLEHIIEYDGIWFAFFFIGYLMLHIYCVYDMYDNEINNIKFISLLRKENMWLQQENTKLTKYKHKVDLTMKNMETFKKLCKDMIQMVEDVECELGKKEE